MYVRESDDTAKLKIYIRNTWDFLTVQLKRTDVNYILNHCNDKKECSPTLQKRGKEWFLDFPFKEKVYLKNTKVEEQTIVAVDLGLNHACVCSVMNYDGTILGREFFQLFKRTRLSRTYIKSNQKEATNRS
ncbi:hypothetical protein P261_01226 [Lachnospiraceae bacterium TWA4]|nr:hypothetical protein P261_01226 [Lachnospiraceae bacterium TWA4]